MARRAHQREDRLARSKREIRGQNSGPHGAAGMLTDAGEEWRIIIEVMRALEAFEVCGGVREQGKIVGCGFRQPPFPFRVR